MKKKVKARDLREARKNEQKAKYNSPMTADKSENTKAMPERIEKHKKSYNKAAGLKSTIISEDTLYMTSFGKGNKAVIEQKINTSDYSCSAMKESPSLDIKKADNFSVSFASSRFDKKDNLIADNPLYTSKNKIDKKISKKAGEDILGLKDRLEKIYFGKTFDDNLHIQIIYNILDIEKIIAQYSTNISAAINHMIDDNDKDYDVTKNDFIGYMSTQNTYDIFMNPSKNPNLDEKIIDNIKKSCKKFETLLKSKRLGYFGLDYNPNGKDEKTKKRLYHLMALAGQLRQWSFHSNGQSKWLYNLNNNMDKEYFETLNYYFDSRFKEINKEFTDNNKVNLLILKKIFSDKDFHEIAELYYDFIVRKSYKNIGFSITKLRENMLTQPEAWEIVDKSMDSVRSKLYKLIDFCIFYEYYSNPAKIEENVNNLRAYTTEEEKEQFYKNESKKLWLKHKYTFLELCDNMTGENIEKLKKCNLEKCIDLEKYRKDSNVSYFSKLLYVMCFFLDGKEINDLLTTLINKFDNIASFIETAKALNINVNFVNDYKFFENSETYVEELNIIKNIARMKKPTATAKKNMFRDALSILGIPHNMSDDDLDAAIEELVKIEYDPVTHQKIKRPHDYRNFIANNIIENKRFIYVVKFCNPSNVRYIVNNTKVTEFVLKRMPTAQIDRYYESCTKDTDRYYSLADIKYKIQQLSEMMRDMSFNDFSNVKQNCKGYEAIKKERYKAIVGLYLTVVYLIIKNLVNINSRYVMAFHCLERDTWLYNKKYDKKTTPYIELTDELCQEGNNSHSGYLARNKRLRKCVEQDIANAKTINSLNKNMAATRLYRNLVAHLTAVRNCDAFINDIEKVESYFALYHYIIQRQLADNIPETAKNSSYYGQLYKWNTYVKDFVKALNSPFGYNIPRFKALTIKELFDRNEMAKETKENLILTN